MPGGEVQVSMLQATWFCREAIQSGKENKDCVYSSQQWGFNNNPQHLKSLLHFWYLKF